MEIYARNNNIIIHNVNRWEKKSEIICKQSSFLTTALFIASAYIQQSICKLAT